MITAAELLPYIANLATQQKKPIPTFEDIDAILQSKDENALIQSWRDRIEAKLWDGVSDINTASASYIRESNPHADLIYVLLIDNEIVFMQTHDPFSEGWVAITSDTVDAVSSKHADAVALDTAQNVIIQDILTAFDLAKPFNLRGDQLQRVASI